MFTRTWEATASGQTIGNAGILFGAKVGQPNFNDKDSTIGGKVSVEENLHTFKRR
jgi:hypothetical protein